MKIRNSVFVWMFLMMTMAITSAYAELEVETIEPIKKATLPAKTPDVTTVSTDATKTIIAVSNISDTITFLNGETFKGLIQSIDCTQNTLSWKHPFSATPISFDLNWLYKINLSKRNEEASENNTSVTLSNGDIVRGKLIDMNDESITLDVKYAKKLTIRKVMIQRIDMGKASGTLYEGPNSKEEWSNLGGQKNFISFKNKTLTIKNPLLIAKGINDLPDRIVLSFNYEWLDTYPSLSIGLFNTAAANPETCYQISIMNNQVAFARLLRNRGGDQGFGNSEFPRSIKKRKMNVQIFADQKKRSFVIFIEGKNIGQWNDPDSTDKLGKYFYFQNQSMSMKLSNIKISSWDGSLPSLIAEDKEADAPEEDTVILTNGDKATGSLKKMVDDKASFVTAFAPMDIPLERISSIILGAKKMERARRNANDIRASFHEGGKITFDLVSMKNGSLSGKSENFGEISVPVEMLSEIEFNIYKEKDASLSETNDE